MSSLRNRFSKSNPDELENLAALVVQGDKNAFRQIYETLHEEIFHFVISRLKSSNNHWDHMKDAEDITADVFVKTWKGADQFQSTQGSFKSWVFGIAKNEISSFFRKNNKRLNHYSLNGDTDRVWEGKKPEEIVADKIKVEIIRSIIDEFPETQRMILLEKLDTDELIQVIAQKCGVNESTARGYIAEGKKRVKLEMEEKERKSKVA